MRYAKATIEVIFEHDDAVPATLAAASIASHMFAGDMLVINMGDVEPLTTEEVVSTIGCGECDTCQANREMLTLREVMEGSALSRQMGQAPAGAIAAESVAIDRARRTI